jgi:hypothetical protein
MNTNIVAPPVGCAAIHALCRGHNLADGPIGEEFLRRMTQFFDYYL